jgi:hypothetical protein
LNISGLYLKECQLQTGVINRLQNNGAYFSFPQHFSHWGVKQDWSVLLSGFYYYYFIVLFFWFLSIPPAEILVFSFTFTAGFKLPTPETISSTLLHKIKEKLQIGSVSLSFGNSLL